ncbi:MAG: type I restriction endonuclease subunit R [Anaerolineaceae bacterium]|jgi:type I restriction enzyme R subunit
MTLYNIVAFTAQATVVAEYKPLPYDAKDYQSEAQLEQELLRQLEVQGYEIITIPSETALIGNLRLQLETLNKMTFSDKEWKRFFQDKIANANEGIIDKTRKIQVDHIQLLEREDGSKLNIRLIDKVNVHNNKLQVLNQYEEAGGKRPARYDVTILVNGLPMVHIELKRRGVALREAFNQIRRYQREAFWAGSGLFDYVQIFVISNGTHTRYYSNTTRDKHIKENSKEARKRKQGNDSYAFTNYWADGNNSNLSDLRDFTQTFFSKHTLLNVLVHFCVFNAKNELMIMRPYQIAATERILSRIRTSSNAKQTGRIEAGGYIWHTTGSGKTLTSFKTAQLATEIEGIEKVLFVVDRKDLDYQTIVEYEKFQKGAANGNTSTKVLQENLEDPGKKILVTTIQKLDRFIALNRSHPIYKKHVVIIFDECHRSQFGAMHKAITRAFSNYHLFGFTGTPIFASNAPTGIKAVGATTEQVFGERLHSYTIVDAINDGNVLPFRIDYLNTVKMKDDIVDAKVPAIDVERAMMAPERISEVSEYLLDHFEQKTKRDSHYFYDDRKLAGFNAIFAVASIPMAKAYYSELKRQMALRSPKLKIGLIYSFNPNEDLEGGLPDESFDTESLDQSSRDFLDEAIADYNRMFNTNYDSSSKNFENYYKDLSMRVKQREVDLLLVVNMFLTGFDATTLNTLWVDKNLRQHGLIQAFSRTNRILNTVKTFGNIVCFRDLKQETDDAIALFGNKDAGGIVLLKTFEEYYETGFLEKGRHQPSYLELVGRLTSTFPLGVEIRGEEAQREFIRLYGSILRVRNILQAFDEFAGKDVLSERELQDYQSIYLDLYQDLRVGAEAEKVVINDDLVFEIELIKQIEVNLDYILMLVARYQESKLEDKEILTTIDRSINASLELRSKKDLIQGFIDRVNMQTDIEKDWPEYVAERKEKELLALIKEESLHEEPTRRFVENAFRDKEMRTIGPAIDEILPPISFFDPARATKKQTVIDKLLAFFERFLGLAGES